MDPDSCLDAIFQYLKEGNIKEAGYLLTQLEEWLRKGGYPPAMWTGNGDTNNLTDN